MNKTTFYFTFLISACIITFSACKKDDTEKEPTFPLGFYTERVESITDIRLFTKDGEIKSPKKIADFARKIEFFSNSYNLDQKGSYHFRFLNRDTVEFKGYNNTFKYSVVKKDDQFTFISDYPYEIQNYNPNDLIHKIFKNKPIHIAAPFGRDYFQSTEVVYGNYNKLTIPILVCYIRYGNSKWPSKFAGFMHNEINMSTLSSLKDQDTVAFKSYRIIAKAK